MGEVVHASWICSSGAELHTVIRVAARERRPNGAMAQLVARFHGMEEVGGSNPPSSTEKTGTQFVSVGFLLLREPGVTFFSLARSLLRF